MKFIYSTVVYLYISFMGRIISYFIDNTELDTQLSFIGSLLGGVLSFLGVFITIRYTKKQFKEEIKMSEEQFKEDKRISIKPYLDIRLKEYNNEGIAHLGIFTINDFKNLNLYKQSNIGVEITNLGQGNCLECKLVGVKINDKKIDDEIVYISNLKISESILVKITFMQWYGDILEEIREKSIGKNIGNSYENFKKSICSDTLNVIELQFEYKDVLENKYNKNIVIETYIDFNILNEKYIWEVSDIEFHDICYEINGNLTTEELIK